MRNKGGIKMFIYAEGDDIKKLQALGLPQVKTWAPDGSAIFVIDAKDKMKIPFEELKESKITNKLMF